METFDVIDIIDDLLRDLWMNVASSKGYRVACGTDAYERLRAEFDQFYSRPWPPYFPTINFRHGTYDVSEDPELPPRHIVLKDRWGNVRFGAVLAGETT
jgi:hypothetical protein